MKISSTTRLIRKLCEPFTDEIKIMKQMGFEAVDFDLNFKLSEQYGVNWRAKIEKMADDAAKYNTPIVQTHLPYGFDKNGVREPATAEITKEAIIATEIMGVKYAAFHAANPMNGGDGLKETYEVFAPIVDFAKSHNVEMLVEMMPDFCAFPITIEELCSAADMLGIGICWDFGHPNVNKFGKNNDQREIMRIAGGRIKALHIHDNTGGRPDSHIPPYLGSIKWDETIPVLNEIGYEGNLNFEVLSPNVPKEQIPMLCKYVVEIGHKFRGMLK